MAHILVSGANGFIGSHLVRKLLKMKEKENWQEDILCLVRSTSDLSSLKNLEVKLVIGDLRHPATLVNAVKGATFIYHLGAELFAVSRQGFLESIYEGTQNLLNAAGTHAKGTLKRFLYVSSQAAAGPAETDKVPVTEDREPPPPVSWYAEAKLKAEKTVNESKLPVTIVRPSAVFGERDPAFLIVFKLVEKRIQARTGFRKRYTSMVYAHDLVEGMIAAANNPKTIHQIYFLSNPENYTVKEMIKTMARAIGKTFGIAFPVPIFLFRIIAIFNELLLIFTRRKPIPARDKIRDFSQRLWLCSPEKANRDFGWVAKTSLLEGMKSTYKYIKEEEYQVKKMPDESRGILWIKYFFLSLAFGILIEVLAAFGKIYFFKPWWISMVVILILWGIVFGSIAMATRTRAFLIQFMPGFVILFAGELLNHYYFDKWYFVPGTFLEKMSPVMRASVLGIATGFLIPIINAGMRSLYKRKQRFG